MPLEIYPIKADAMGHRTRFSDSSFYDEVCVTCGATDAGSALNSTCPKQVTDEEHAAERLETAKRQLIGGGSVTVIMMRNHGPGRDLDAYWAKEWPRIADLIEVLLEERKKPGYEQGYRDGESSIHADYSAAFDGIVDVFSGPQDLAKQIEAKLEKVTAPLVAKVDVNLGEALLKDKTPEEQQEMIEGFRKWFDIQREKSKELEGPSMSVVFFIGDEEVYRVDDAQKQKSDKIEFVAPRSGPATWGIEVHGVVIMTEAFHTPQIVKNDIVSLDGFHADLKEVAKAVKPKASTIGDEQDRQRAADQIDAVEFGVSYKTVKMTREAYDGDQYKTGPFCLPAWNTLSAAQRKEYILRKWEGSPG